MSRSQTLIEALRISEYSHYWYAYRHAIDEMPFEKSVNFDAAWLKQQIKTCLDPNNNIVAPEDIKIKNGYVGC